MPYTANDLIAATLNALPKFVVSRTRSTLNWTGSSLARNVGTEVAAMKERFSKEVQVHGNCDLRQRSGNALPHQFRYHEQGRGGERISPKGRPRAGLFCP